MDAAQLCAPGADCIAAGSYTGYDWSKFYFIVGLAVVGIVVLGVCYIYK
jgi:hypothetical protein